jgi:hypothetical protein
MGLALFQERRMDLRKKLTGLLPGRLRSSKGNDINCRPVDVSENGLGIISKDNLAVNDVVELQVKDILISLKVGWVKPDFGKRDLFRYGLVSQNAKYNLEEIFISSGCMK